MLLSQVDEFHLVVDDRVSFLCAVITFSSVNCSPLAVGSAVPPPPRYITVKCCSVYTTCRQTTHVVCWLHDLILGQVVEPSTVALQASVSSRHLLSAQTSERCAYLSRLHSHLSRPGRLAFMFSSRVVNGTVHRDRPLCRHNASLLRAGNTPNGFF